jgi:hypothetical protein
VRFDKILDTCNCAGADIDTPEVFKIDRHDVVTAPYLSVCLTGYRALCKKYDNKV